MKIFVFAANEEEFNEWYRNIMPNCLNDFEYVPHSRIALLRGIPWKKTGLIFLNGFWETARPYTRKEAEKLVTQAMLRRGRGK